MAAEADLTVFWGVASGSSHACFRRHFEGHPSYQLGPDPERLMLNYRTQINGLWAGPKWMIDSGGAPQTIIRHGGHPDSIHDYIDYLREPPTRYGDDRQDVRIEQFALRDWPCEPDVRQALDLSVEELQYRTLIDHINMMDALERERFDADPVAVLQGWDIEDYLVCIDLFRDHGLLTDKLAVGTLCGRQNTTVIRNTSWRIARNLPGRVSLHGFGVKQSALREPDVLRIFDSMDTLAWDQRLRQDTKDGIQQGPVGGSYGNWIDWDERGNPRYTARNLWLAFRRYAERLDAIRPAETPSDVRVVTINQLHELTGGPAPPGQRVDKYVIAQCVCGGYIDPGRPDPHYGPICRHCERAATNILVQRVDLEDDLQRRGFEAAFGGPRPVSGLGPWRDEIGDDMAGR